MEIRAFLTEIRLEEYILIVLSLALNEENDITFP